MTFSAALAQCNFERDANNIVRLRGERRGRDEDNYMDTDPRPRQRRRTSEPAWSIDPNPSPAHEMPDDVPPEEAGRRNERSFQFGTGGGRGDGEPSRPPMPFDWARYDSTWREYNAASYGQIVYQEILMDDNVRVCVTLGRAGTGKTLLAVQEGLRQLKDGTVKKIILGRPAVQAGEDLGFLPGAEKDKLQPLLAPMLDAIDKIMGQPGAWAGLQNKNLLEMQSFAFMRGRTHENAFVIADEVQNASLAQLKLLATRVGDGSKLCILGDGSQPDRKVGGNWSEGKSSIELFVEKIESGLMERAGVEEELGDRCKVVRLTNADCQRSATARAMNQLFDTLEDEIAPRRNERADPAGLLRQAMQGVGA